MTDLEKIELSLRRVAARVGPPNEDLLKAIADQIAIDEAERKHGHEQRR